MRSCQGRKRKVCVNVYLWEAGAAEPANGVVIKISPGRFSYQVDGTAAFVTMKAELPFKGCLHNP